MKIKNNMAFAIGGAGLLSLLSFSAIADSSTSPTLEKMVQATTEKHLTEERNKYTQLVSLAGNRQGELTTRMHEVINAYKEWRESISSVATHYTSSKDYKAIEAAAKAYTQANKAFIELQKDILAQNGMPVYNVSINTLSRTEPTLALAN